MYFTDRVCVAGHLYVARGKDRVYWSRWWRPLGRFVDRGRRIGGIKTSCLNVKSRGDGSFNVFRKIRSKSSRPLKCSCSGGLKKVIHLLVYVTFVEHQCIQRIIVLGSHK